MSYFRDVPGRGERVHRMFQVKTSPVESRGRLHNLLPPLSSPVESQSLYPSLSWALGCIQSIFQKQIASWGVIICCLLLPRGAENGWANGLEWKSGKYLVKSAALQFAANEADIFSADGLGKPGIWFTFTPSGEMNISSQMQPFPQPAMIQRLLCYDLDHLSVTTEPLKIFITFILRQRYCQRGVGKLFV